MVIREPTAVAAPVVPPSRVHGKGKKVRIPSCSPSSSDDEGSFCDDPLPGHLVVCYFICSFALYMLHTPLFFVYADFFVLVCFMRRFFNDV